MTSSHRTEPTARRAKREPLSPLKTGGSPPAGPQGGGRPGSSLYVVYSHGAWTGDLINDRGTLSPRRDLAAMSHLRGDDAIQVKVSWLFR